MRMDLSRRILESFRSRWIIPRVCSSVSTVNGWAGYVGDLRLYLS
jgi:hypothetical protein